MNAQTNYPINTSHMYRSIIFISFLLFISMNLVAQRDTTRKQSIDIISSYKPVLRNAVKINFSGSQLPADTSKSVKEYSIPSHNLFYAYQPITLKPLALQQDTNLYLGTRNFLKAGFGNLNTPYVRAGFGIGDGRKSLVNLYADYIGSQGTIKNQDYSQMNVKTTGSYFFPKNELYGSAAFSRNNYYLYGYNHSRFNYKKDEIRQQFQEINVTAGFRNTASNGLRISYNPNVQLNFFTNKDKLSETTIIVNIPAEKKIGEKVAIKATINADITNYSTSIITPNNHTFTNNVVELSPAVVYSSPRFTINGGITPVWNNGKFQYLPNVFAEGQLQEKVFMIQAGWVGRILKNTYRNLSSSNPYILPIFAANNTKEVEIYGGIKASIGKHFNFSAKAGWITYNDLPFFLGDQLIDGDGKDFTVSNEPKVNDLRIHADVSYINQDKFTVTAGLTLNGYTGMTKHEKAWNTIPMEFTSSLRWWAFERLLLKGDFYFINGGNYLDYGSSVPLKGGTDLSAGLEFKINRQFSAFLDVNNIFNDKYERWHNYQVYGLNLLGGIIIKF